jgi:para-aminobenzoate synthetase/4-amino-4-deoxychorismate lyase
LNTPLPDPTIATILSRLRAEENFVFLETSKTTAEECSSLLFTKPVAQLSFHAGQAPDAFFATAQGYLDHGYFLAGWFAYEFGHALEPVLTPYLSGSRERPLVRLGVYPPPLILDQSRPWPDDNPPLPFTDPPCPHTEGYQLADLRPSLSEAEYQQRLARIKEYIVAGDTYQVNYTIKLLFEFNGSPEALYLDLRRNQPVSYGAYLNLDGERILSFSPELFFRKQGRHCQVRPMKGTTGRGRTMAEDEQLAAALQRDPKNRSENVMIVDLLRNDLGRISTMGGVEMTSLFQVESYATLHQMTSTITGRIADHIGLAELFKALFPCGSVTGAPKIRTMEIIRELEAEPRGVYTGAIGYLAPSGDAVFNVPIRTVVLNGNRGEMGIGSGIVHDSNPEAEWRECLLKGRFLTAPRPSFQLIETILWQRTTGFWLLELHLARMADSAAYFDYPLDRAALGQRLQTEALTFRNEAVRVRILLHQDGRITISATPCALPTALDLPTPRATGLDLPRVMVSPRTTDSSSPFLYHKTTCRDLYASERQRAVDLGYEEVLFTNENGEITEGSITNILIRQGDRLVTPPLRCGLLAGVCREHLRYRHPGVISEQVLHPADLLAADAIYLANSVRGLIQVRLELTPG